MILPCIYPQGVTRTWARSVFPSGLKAILMQVHRIDLPALAMTWTCIVLCTQMDMRSVMYTMYFPHVHYTHHTTYCRHSNYTSFLILCQNSSLKPIICCTPGTNLLLLLVMGASSKAHTVQLNDEEGASLASFPGRVGGEKASSLLPRGLGTRLVHHFTACER